MKKLFKFLIKLWRGRDHLQEYRLKAIDIVNKIKDAVNSDEATLVTKIIPGTSDDKLLIMIRAWLPKILANLNLSTQTTITGAVLESVRGLKSLEKKHRAPYYSTIAGNIYSNLSGLPLDTAMYQVEEEYQKLS